MGDKLKVNIAITGRNNRIELRVLTRDTRWAPDGIMYESEHRYAVRLVDQLTPGQTVVTPAICESHKAHKNEAGLTTESKEAPLRAVALEAQCGPRGRRGDAARR